MRPTFQPALTSALTTLRAWAPTIAGFAVFAGAVAITTMHAAAATTTNPLEAVGQTGSGFDLKTINFATGPLGLLGLAHAGHDAHQKAKQANYNLMDLLHAGVGFSFVGGILGGIALYWNHVHSAGSGAMIASIISKHIG